MDMLDRVETAMSEAEGPDDGLRMERMARAALATLRNEPHTTEMFMAAAEVLKGVSLNEGSDAIYPALIFKAMLSAILDPSEPEHPANG